MAELFLVPPDRRLCSGHDVSDGGLVTCLLEMAFAGNCGIEVDVPAPGIHGEELGLWPKAWAAFVTCGPCGVKNAVSLTLPPES